MGCISPLGNDVPSTWAAALAGQSGAAPITLFDASEHETRFAAEVKGYDAGEKFGRKEARRMDRYTQFAMGATAEAMAHAGLTVTEGNRDRIGVFIGTGIGGVGTLLAEAEVRIGCVRAAGPGCTRARVPGSTPSSHSRGPARTRYAGDVTSTCRWSPSPMPMRTIQAPLATSSKRSAHSTATTPSRANSSSASSSTSKPGTSR